MISAPLIDVDGDAATSFVDFVWFSRAGEAGRIGRYHDTLVRDPDQWRFAIREIVFAGRAPRNPAQAEVYLSLIYGDGTALRPGDGDPGRAGTSHDPRHGT